MQAIPQSLKVLIKYVLKRYDLRLVKEFSAKFIVPANWTTIEDHIFEYCKEVVRALENDHGVTTGRDAIRGLRQLSLDDFGLILFSMPDPQYPKLSRLLPAMASNEVQRHWMGNHGLLLLKQTTAFVRAVSYHFTRITRTPLDRATVLEGEEKDIGEEVLASSRPLFLYKPDGSAAPLTHSEVPVHLADVVCLLSKEDAAFACENFHLRREGEARKRKFFYYYWGKEYHDWSKE